MRTIDGSRSSIDESATEFSVRIDGSELHQLSLIFLRRADTEDVYNVSVVSALSTRLNQFVLTRRTRGYNVVFSWPTIASTSWR